jgi:hypothetical protein
LAGGHANVDRDGTQRHHYRHTKYWPARLEQVRVGGTLRAVPADVEAV